MQVKVTIKNPKGGLVEHVAEVSQDGDLLRAVGAAMETYRKAHHDIPIFDHSTIMIERTNQEVAKEPYQGELASAFHPL